MDITKKHFTELMSAFLNSRQALYCPDADYGEIFRLAEIHNVSGVAAGQIMGFSAADKAKIKELNKFKQFLGHTIINYEIKNEIKAQLKKDFESAEIPYLFVKGAAIRQLYPLPALRTSGDTDLFFMSRDYNRVKNIYLKKGVAIALENKNEIVLNKDGEEIELHSDSDFDNGYFKNIFSIAEKSSEFEYSLSLENHLLYVLCHIAKHLNHCGAGIRMFMNVDVILRHIKSIDDSFFEKARAAGIETFTEAAFYLCNKWFNTPVDSKFVFDPYLLDFFENTVIDGGNFGFENRNLGEYYINKSIGANGKNTVAAKIKAFLILMFPPAVILKSAYAYCDRHRLLLPAAWLNRIFDGIFRRGRHSKNTISQIMKTNKKSEDYWRLMQELEI